MSKSKDGFKIPKAKKHSSNLKYFCLPLPSTTPAVGVFNGFNVVICDWDSMNQIHRMGCFGKGTLSKGAPVHHFKKDDIPRVIFENQYNKMLKWNNQAHYSCCEKYSGTLKNDYQLSVESIDNLLKFSFANDCQDYWKSWKRKCSKTVNKGNERSQNATNPQLLLEFTSGAENYTDAEFVKMVEGILSSKEGRQIKFSNKNYEDVIVVANDSKTPESLTDLDVRLEKLTYVGEENLNLTLEESFFLKFATNTLKIVDVNLTELDVPALWTIFNSTREDFLVKYVIYHYYRTKGWIIKSGLKFGGQYLLYKQGPAYYHSTYLIQVLDKRKNMKWKDFIGMNRLVETYNKDLVLCSVESKTSSSGQESFPKGLKNYRVQEVLTRRWFPSKERFQSSIEEQK